MDKVFKALADPTRRYLLDSLHEDNGQTLAALPTRVELGLSGDDEPQIPWDMPARS